MNKKLWIDYALSQGFTSCVIYQATAEEKNVAWFDHQMDSYVTSHVLGTALRGVLDGKMVNLATEDASDEQMETLIADMLRQAAAITSDDAGIIRSPENAIPLESVRSWKEPAGPEVQAALSSLEQALASYDPRIIQVTDLSWERSRSVRQIVNSNSMDLRDESCYQILMAGVAASDGSEVKTAYKIEVVEDLFSFDQSAFVKELCEDVLGKLGAKSLKSGSYPVILERKAMTSLFSAFSGMFSGELIGKGISPLKDKLDAAVFSEKISVLDDPRDPQVLSCCAFDDEGCPTRAKTLVDGGVFRMMLHDSKSAARLGAESTGNGFKAGYASPVGVQPMGLRILPGEKSLEELQAALGDCFVIQEFQGLHAGVDPVTTDFSLQCAGYWVKDGKKERSVTLVTAAGNFLDLMKKVTEVGNDLDWSYYSIACPSIAFSECAISGE